MKCRFAKDLKVFLVRCRYYIRGLRGEGIIGACTIDPKTVLVFGGFSQRQPQLITLSDEVRVDLVSMPKFTQQITAYSH